MATLKEIKVTDANGKSTVYKVGAETVKGQGEVLSSVRMQSESAPITLNMATGTYIFIVVECEYDFPNNEDYSDSVKYHTAMVPLAVAREYGNNYPVDITVPISIPNKDVTRDVCIRIHISASSNSIQYNVTRNQGMYVYAVNAKVIS